MSRQMAPPPKACGGVRAFPLPLRQETKKPASMADADTVHVVTFCQALN